MGQQDSGDDKIDAGASPPRRLLLKNHLSPGDLVMLTAAVRDLHRSCPDQFITDVRTSCPELWEANPWITPLEEEDSDVEVIECHYPLIHRCNDTPYHCIHGFIEFLNEKLDLAIRPTAFRGEVPLSKEEKGWFSQIYELTECDIPFWIIDAGGKFDVTIKWWSSERYQEVIDRLRGSVQFVQIGQLGHHHPPLEGVIDLRGQTTLRELVRLVYHAQGALCTVTALMHLAAAIEMRGRPDVNRPCVVIAGGREPAHWEAYPDHQFLHTNGALKCCMRGGCWKDRVKPLGDGDKRDEAENLCVDVRGDLPRCMDMIAADDVVRRIEGYLSSGAFEPLTPRQCRAAQRAVDATRDNFFENDIQLDRAMEKTRTATPA
jgi:ADP-heptose:LPS heptosyltransferase